MVLKSFWKKEIKCLFAHRKIIFSGIIEVEYGLKSYMLCMQFRHVAQISRHITCRFYVLQRKHFPVGLYLIGYCVTANYFKHT